MLRIKMLPFVLQNRNENTYQTVVTEFWIVKTLFTLSPEFLKGTLSCDSAISQYQSVLSDEVGIPKPHTEDKKANRTRVDYLALSDDTAIISENGRRPEKQLDNMNKTDRRIRLRIPYNKTKTLNAIGIG